MVTSSPCSGGRYFRVGGCRSVRFEEMPSGSGELELLGSDSIGKTQLFDVFSGVSCFVYIFCTEQMVPLFTIKTYFMIFSYPRKWIQVVQLGDWALPGRIRWYAQRRKPPFYFWVFAPLPWYQNDSWWRWEMLDPEMCTSKSPCSPRFVGQTLSYVFFG